MSKRGFPAVLIALGLGLVVAVVFVAKRRADGVEPREGDALSSSSTMAAAPQNGEPDVAAVPSTPSPTAERSPVVAQRYRGRLIARPQASSVRNLTAIAVPALHASPAAIEEGNAFVLNSSRRLARDETVPAVVHTGDGGALPLDLLAPELAPDGVLDFGLVEVDTRFRVRVRIELAPDVADWLDAAGLDGFRCRVADADPASRRLVYEEDLAFAGGEARFEFRTERSVPLQLDVSGRIGSAVFPCAQVARSFSEDAPHVGDWTVVVGASDVVAGRLIVTGPRPWLPPFLRIRAVHVDEPARERGLATTAAGDFFYWVGAGGRAEVEFLSFPAGVRTLEPGLGHELLLDTRTAVQGRLRDRNGQPVTRFQVRQYAQPVKGRNHEYDSWEFEDGVAALPSGAAERAWLHAFTPDGHFLVRNHGLVARVLDLEVLTAADGTVVVDPAMFAARSDGGHVKLTKVDPPAANAMYIILRRHVDPPRVERVLPGRYTCVVVDGEGNDHRKEITVRSGEVTEVRF